MLEYHNLLRRILGDGAKRNDRTGTGTLSVFGHQMRFDLAHGFPLITTKKLHFKSIVHELLWFLAGDTNVRSSQRAWRHASGTNGRTSSGELGPVYGLQWRSWPAPDGGAIDQIADVVAESAAIPIRGASSSAPGMPPTSIRWRCRRATACSSSTSRTVDSPVSFINARADVFLGVPFNIASYALLTLMVAQVTG